MSTDEQRNYLQALLYKNTLKLNMVFN